MVKLDSTTLKIKRQYVMFQRTPNIPGELGYLSFKFNKLFCHTLVTISLVIL